MQVCIVYDCLYPYTIGGAERWYRSLAEHLVAAGHDVTFLTLRQWEPGTGPDVTGVRVVAVGPALALYTSSGRRRVLPPIVFGAGVLLHLLRRGRRYDVVHTASFPYFSVLAAAVARRRGSFRLVVDWHEVWTRPYWRTYLGPVAGSVGWRIQRACLRTRQTAFCFSKLHESRLREQGLEGPLVRLEGQYAGGGDPPEPAHPRAVAVFAGRLIPEKRATTFVAAIAGARAQIAGLHGEIYGDGPERAAVLELIAERGLDGVVSAPGFVDDWALQRARASALCLVLPSEREGYGLVVVEASACGVPTVVVPGPDNAATELVEDGVNGVVAAGPEPAELAAAIVAVAGAGSALRESTAEWFHRNAERLSLGRSLERVLQAYAGV